MVAVADILIVTDHHHHQPELPRNDLLADRMREASVLGDLPPDSVQFSTRSGSLERARVDEECAAYVSADPHLPVHVVHSHLRSCCFVRSCALSSTDNKQHTRSPDTIFTEYDARSYAALSHAAHKLDVRNTTCKPQAGCKQQHTIRKLDTQHNIRSTD